MIVAFSTLSVLATEPMHPQGLSCRCMGGFVLLASGPGRRVALSALRAAR